VPRRGRGRRRHACCGPQGLRPSSRRRKGAGLRRLLRSHADRTGHPSARQPRAMREIHGVGDTKLERYGAAFLSDPGPPRADERNRWPPTLLSSLRTRLLRMRSLQPIERWVAAGTEDMDRRVTTRWRPNPSAQGPHRCGGPRRHPGRRLRQGRVFLLEGTPARARPRSHCAS
jgi:hypothetical protein